MEVEGANKHKLAVFTYELLGTAVLVFNILVSNGDAIVGPLTVFLIILVLAPVTGAHFNPAVTIGVYISRSKFRQDILFFFIMIFAQIIGGILALVLSVLALYSMNNPEGQWLVIPDLVPILCPIGIEQGTITPCDLSGNRHIQAFAI